MTAELTIVIPTHARPVLLAAAVTSALAQDVPVQVVVVDDGSPEPVDLPADPRLRVLRHGQARGGSAARNLGAREARTRYVMWLDDDDELLPHAARISLEALRDCALAAPVAVLSGIEVLDADGRVRDRRIPPPVLPRGGHFWLEGPVPGHSYHTKQTLVVDRAFVLDLGGFDPAFRSRVHTELFLRLNPACTLIGLPEVTYRLRAHAGPRVSTDPGLRQRSADQLMARHRAAFAAHPGAHAAFLLEHARHLWALDRRRAAGRAVLGAARAAPVETLLRAAGALRQRVGSR